MFFVSRGGGRNNAIGIATDDNKVIRKTASKAAPVFMLYGYKSRPLAITEFDEKLWLTVVDTAVVSRDGIFIFRFRNGAEITA